MDALFGRPHHSPSPPPPPNELLLSLHFLSNLSVWEGLHVLHVPIDPTHVHSLEGEGGYRLLKLLSTHWRRPYKTWSDVIRIVFYRLMSFSSGSLHRPPAVGQKLARTQKWGKGLKVSECEICLSLGFSPFLYRKASMRRTVHKNSNLFCSGHNFKVFCS